LGQVISNTPSQCDYARRNLNALIGVEFELQGIRFLGTEECKPCYWMEQAFHPGAEAAMKGRGGLRARILTDGVLRSTSALRERVTREPRLSGNAVSSI
jgi:MOSC domain-containing protein YiiM